MDDTLLNILAGAADGLERSSKNIFAVTQAKHEMDQKDQLFQLDKKAKEIQLQQAEINGANPEDIALKRKMNALNSAITGKKLEAESFAIDKTRQDLLKEKQNHEMQLKIITPLLQKALSGGTLPRGFTLKSGGSFSMSGGPVEKADEESLEELLNEAHTSKETPAATDSNKKYTPEIEDYIQKAMDAYGKTRQEVVEALQQRGAL